MGIHFAFSIMAYHILVFSNHAKAVWTMLLEYLGIWKLS